MSPALDTQGHGRRDLIRIDDPQVQASLRRDICKVVCVCGHASFVNGSRRHLLVGEDRSQVKTGRACPDLFSILIEDQVLGGPSIVGRGQPDVQPIDGDRQFALLPGDPGLGEQIAKADDPVYLAEAFQDGRIVEHTVAHGINVGFVPARHVAITYDNRMQIVDLFEKERVGAEIACRIDSHRLAYQRSYFPTIPNEFEQLDAVLLVLVRSVVDPLVIARLLVGPPVVAKDAEGAHVVLRGQQVEMVVLDGVVDGRNVDHAVGGNHDSNVREMPDERVGESNQACGVRRHELSRIGTFSPEAEMAHFDVAHELLALDRSVAKGLRIFQVGRKGGQQCIVAIKEEGAFEIRFPTGDVPP